MARDGHSGLPQERTAPELVINHGTNEQTTASREPSFRAPHPVFWVIAGALLVIATALVVRRDIPISSAAFAQLPTAAGARGVFAFSGQLTKASYGVFVVDTDLMTIWAYEFNAQKGCLRLAGARSWQYDRYLENHNLCDLPPDVVEKMVEEQRQLRSQSTEQQLP